MCARHESQVWRIFGGTLDVGDLNKERAEAELLPSQCTAATARGSAAFQFFKYHDKASSNISGSFQRTPKPSITGIRYEPSLWRFVTFRCVATSFVADLQAAKHIHLGHSDTEGRWTVFGQAFRQVKCPGSTFGVHGLFWIRCRGCSAGILDSLGRGSCETPKNMPLFRVGVHTEI